MGLTLPGLDFFYLIFFFLNVMGHDDGVHI